MAGYPSARPLPRTDYGSGPWQGVRDTSDPTAADPSKLLVGTNILLQQEDIGTFARVRPGFGRNVTLTGRTYGRAAYQYTKLDGTTYSLIFVDSKMYTLTTGALTEVTLGIGITIAAADPSHPGTYPVYCTTFADFLVVSDGVNKPWTWDGSGFNVLTAASGAWYGRPFVYYGKLGGILAADRTTFEWSNEGDPFSGYSGAFPTQSWQLRQTSSEPLNAMLGTNDGLYYWRDGSFDAIRGPVSEDFSTSGTVSGISLSVGSKSPDAIELVGSTVFFLDQDGRPRRYTIGGGIDALWEDATVAMRYASADSLPKACARYWIEPGIVVFAIPNSTTAHMVLVFDGESGMYQGNWVSGPIANSNPEYPGTFFDAHAFGILQYVANTPLRLTAVSSQVWLFQNPNEAGVGVAGIPYFTDRYVDGANTAVAIEVRIEPGQFGGDSPNPKQFVLLSSFHQAAETGSIGVSYSTSASSTQTTPLTVSVSSSEATAGVSEIRRTVGTSAQCRFIRPRWTHSAYKTASSGYLFTLGRVRAEAAVLADNPFTR